MLSHDVYFTLAEPTTDNINALAAECREYLSGHPGTVFFAAGPCNPDLDRPVNDRDFHVALHVVFESREAHDIYQIRTSRPDPFSDLRLRGDGRLDFIAGCVGADRAMLVAGPASPVF